MQEIKPWREKERPKRRRPVGGINSGQDEEDDSSTLWLEAWNVLSDFLRLQNWTKSDQDLKNGANKKKIGGKDKPRWHSRVAFQHPRCRTRAGLKGVIFCWCVFDLDLLLVFFFLSQGVQFFGVCPMASVVFVRSCNDETANESRTVFVPRFYFLLAHKAAFYCTFIVC